MIWEFYNIFQDIMNYYQTSKLPKALKILVCRSRVNRLIKVMKKAKKLDYYTWSDICMLLKILEIDQYTEYSDRYLFAIDNEDRFTIVDITFNQENQCMDIDCSIKEGDNSIRSSMFGLKDSNPDHSGNTEISRTALQDLNDIIRLYIDQMSKNLKDEAERIYAS